MGPVVSQAEVLQCGWNSDGSSKFRCNLQMDSQFNKSETLLALTTVEYFLQIFGVCDRTKQSWGEDPLNSSWSFCEVAVSLPSCSVVWNSLLFYEPLDLCSQCLQILLQSNILQQRVFQHSLQLSVDLQ